MTPERWVLSSHRGGNGLSEWLPRWGSGGSPAGVWGGTFNCSVQAVIAQPFLPQAFYQEDARNFLLHLRVCP